MGDVPYDIIAEAFASRTVVPFLGAAASFAGASLTDALPSGRRLAEILAAESAYPGATGDPLSKIAQYIEEIPSDRAYLLRKISSIFGKTVRSDYDCALTEFLAALPNDKTPRLFITTNYDLLVERALEQRGLSYLAISHIVGNSKYAGRFFCYTSLQDVGQKCIWTKTEVDERFVEADDESTLPIIVYKIHGTAETKGGSELIDSIVLTESDYIEFLEEERLKKIPTRILTLLREANLLFLGYSLQDWNLRVLLQRLHRIQQRQKKRTSKHWACRRMESLDEVEFQFWAKRDVNLYSVPLEEFLGKLLGKL